MWNSLAIQGYGTFPTVTQGCTGKQRCIGRVIPYCNTVSTVGIQRNLLSLTAAPVNRSGFVFSHIVNCNIIATIVTLFRFSLIAHQLLVSKRLFVLLKRYRAGTRIPIICLRRDVNRRSGTATVCCSGCIYRRKTEQCKCAEKTAAILEKIDF